jgi:hypothetical protein
LAGTNLARGYLEHENLAGATFEGATFEGTNLQQANLEGANLSDANVEGTDVSQARLEGTTVNGTQLGQAYLGIRASTGQLRHTEHLRRCGGMAPIRGNRSVLLRRAGFGRMWKLVGA